MKTGSVLGGGAYGTALAQVMARSEHFDKVQMWVRETDAVASINGAHENKLFLPRVELSKKISATNKIEDALRGSQIVLLAVPTPFLRSVLAVNRSTLPVGVPLVCLSKGIETETLQTPYEIMVEELPGKYHPWIAVLSGPSFAEETARGQPTSVLVASKTMAVAAQVQSALSDDNFRVYTGTDVIGAELGGAVKNVLAIATGAAAGYGFGSNTQAMLITRGLLEMTKLAIKKGASPGTMMGLAGVGDLVLTCTSKQSRNYTVGQRIAKGETLKDILTTSGGAIAEGVKTSQSIHELAAKCGVEMPICEEVYQVLHQGKSFIQALQDLRSRPLSSELQDLDSNITMMATPPPAHL